MTRVTFASLADALGGRAPRRADPTGRMEAAVAIVLAPGGEGLLDVLFIRRAELHGDPWSGQMAFPGGRREERDGGLLETAMRETEEETAIRLAEGRLLGELDDLAPVTPVLPPVFVRPFVFGLPERPRLRPSREVAGHVWAPLERLPEFARRTEVTVRGEPREVPCFTVGPHVVWGMTHRIISHLIELAL